MAGKVLMVQGASSSAGKSLLVAALCHIYARNGVRVAPFKAQNMSNNAAVCPDGGEIGRAQAVQALAAGIELSVDLNPVLIKPEADARSQVILMGKPYSTLSASAYYQHKQVFWKCVTEALDRLRAAYDLVIAEGAGSPAEINLREGDIVNMAVARYAEAAVLLPNAEVVVEPIYVTELIEPGWDVLACGPEPMLEAVRAIAPAAQLAWEAPMACGYGACYGCVVPVDGHLKRLCIEGPVLCSS